MRRMFKRKRRITPFIFILCIFGLTAVFLIHIRPVVMSVANSNLKYIATKVINKAVSDKFSENGINYTDLVVVSKDNDNRVSAVSVNFPAVNKIKSELTLNILENINSIDETQIAIPLGNFFNNEFMSGIGPKIPFKIVPNSEVEINFRDDFKGLSINQTLHEIYLDIETNIMAVMPSVETGTTVRISFLVGHTVIVGDVPETYTGINEIPGSIEDYILDVTP